MKLFQRFIFFVQFWAAEVILRWASNNFIFLYDRVVDLIQPYKGTKIEKGREIGTLPLQFSILRPFCYPLVQICIYRRTGLNIHHGNPQSKSLLEHFYSERFYLLHGSMGPGDATSSRSTHFTVQCSIYPAVIIRCSLVKRRLQYTVHDFLKIEENRVNKVQLYHVPGNSIKRWKTI